MPTDDSNLESISTLKGINNNPRHIAIIMDGNGRWAQKKVYASGYRSSGRG